VWHSPEAVKPRFNVAGPCFEVKLRRDTETETDALEQVDGYLDKAGLSEGWLVMFDLRSTLPWAERLSTRTVDVNGKRIFVVGCCVGRARSGSLSRT